MDGLRQLEICLSIKKCICRRRCDSFCEVADKVVHLLWLHIFKYVNLQKIKLCFFMHKYFSGNKEYKFLLAVKRKHRGLQD